MHRCTSAGDTTVTAPAWLAPSLDDLLTIVLLIIGLYGMLLKRNFVKKLIGMNIFQAAIILCYIVFAFKEGASVPVWSPDDVGSDAASYMNPIPHGLMLTAIGKAR